MKFGRDWARTGGVGDPETTDLDRRAQDVVKFGKVKEVDYSKDPPVYRVLIGDENDEDNHNITDWLPASGGRAKGDTDTHFLEKDEKVVLLAEGGELATAQVMPAGTYTKNNEDEKKGANKAGVWKKKFKTGASMSYDRDTGDYVIDTTGKKQGQGGQQGSGEQEIKGSATIKAAEGTLTMKDGVGTIKFDKAQVDVKKSGIVIATVLERKKFKIKFEGKTYAIKQDALEEVSED